MVANSSTPGRLTLDDGFTVSTTASQLSAQRNTPPSQDIEALAATQAPGNQTNHTSRASSSTTQTIISSPTEESAVALSLGTNAPTEGPPSIESHQLSQVSAYGLTYPLSALDEIPGSAEWDLTLTMADHDDPFTNIRHLLPQSP
ncbi:hypothetical protein K435DRAFT_782199 [Dendrothele bispora CBS 962.96]|uniref:Uncharacterized protein n=1 Tax=Dendrothele bispora (strain CBS 962.96) TaxID=1314807 RepID=A0A4V4HDP3_DENBC|nr:hypothetical protein K435DRAFT_782199 [Dendrothele bispora CBS 962.96]